MKVHRSLRHYIKKQSEKIEQRFKKQSTSFTIEDYHHLRVAVKKINAVGLLLNNAVNKFRRKKLLKSTKKLFRQAGKIRELQMEKKIVTQYIKQGIPEFKAGLNESIKKEKKLFSRMLNKKIHRQIAEDINILSEATVKLSEKDTEAFLKHLRNQLSKILSSKLKRNEMHELRKKLKISYYLNKALSTKAKTAVEETKSLQELLGKWHDMNVIYESLKKALADKGVVKKEIDSINKIKSAVLSESRKLTRNLHFQIQHTSL